jgi:rRNA maturation endonuclease Nob1
MREVASHLSIEDVQNLSKTMGEEEGIGNKLDTAENFLKQHNIFFPKTEKEMDSMLKRYGKTTKEKENEIINCLKCGANIEPGTNFCEQCGHKL